MEMSPHRKLRGSHPAGPSPCTALAFIDEDVEDPCAAVQVKGVGRRGVAREPQATAYMREEGASAGSLAPGATRPAGPRGAARPEAVGSAMRNEPPAPDCATTVSSAAIVRSRSAWATWCPADPTHSPAVAVRKATLAIWRAAPKRSPSRTRSRRAAMRAILEKAARRLRAPRLQRAHELTTLQPSVLQKS